MEIRSNNENDFRQIYTEVFPQLFKVSNNIVRNPDRAEELCQEAFTRFYDKALVFPSENDAKYWLIRVTKNLSINVVKRKSREAHMIEKFKRQPKRKEKTGEDLMVEEASCKEVRDAIEQLPEKLKVVITMKTYTDLDYKEIGATLNISESNVKVRVFRARQMLKKILLQE
ncbi:MAG: RNA polymerase sigma factor [Spirochaetia bacterium]|jgi:RNA polymerase sigma-70 factor (ECF subfamily)|nr:RNA polymerase sigma factor [Spirochaetia bacterium]